jgi:IS5 family transposase
VDARIIAVSSSTKNESGERDPEMPQAKRGNQRRFGVQAHIGAGADAGLVHTVTTTAANEVGVEQVSDLLHGKENAVWADWGYRGAQHVDSWIMGFQQMTKLQDATSGHIHSTDRGPRQSWRSPVSRQACCA